jgi:hypothetical protein
MAVDWFEILQDQGEICKSKVKEVAHLLQRDDLSVDAAASLYSSVERLATQFDDVVADLYEALNDDDPLLDAAETLEHLWIQLCLATANKVRELQGLPPLDPFEQNGGN